MRYSRGTAASTVAIVLMFSVFLALFSVVGEEKNPSWVTPIRHLKSSMEIQYDTVPVLWPLSPRDILTFVLATVGLMFAAGGGIGGGGILVPIYILVLSFTPKHAIPLSNVTVFGGALANLMLNFSKRHPVADRPLIDWNLILIMEPLTLSGALVGANLNVWLPDVVIVLALVILLSLTGYKTFLKSLKLYREETQGWQSVKPDERTLTSTSSDLETGAIELPEPYPLHRFESYPPKHYVTDKKTRIPARRHSLGSETDASKPSREEPVEKEPIVLVSMELEGVVSSTIELEDEREDKNEIGKSSIEKSEEDLLQTILQEERKPPYGSIAVVAALFLFTLTINLLKGGGSLESPLGVECGSASFWLLEAVIILASIGVTLYARWYLLRQGQRKAEAKYNHLEMDIQWNERTTLLYPVFCTLAGVVAGLFGIGGGLVKAPLMLALGVHPAVASATSATMILFTTFTATTSFVAFGMLIWDYGIVCFAIGFGATLIGQMVMNALLRRTGKTSYIAFCITGVVLISALTMTVEWIVALASGASHRSGEFCGQA